MCADQAATGFPSTPGQDEGVYWIPDLWSCLGCFCLWLVAHHRSISAQHCKPLNLILQSDLTPCFHFCMHIPPHPYCYQFCFDFDRSLGFPGEGPSACWTLCSANIDAVQAHPDCLTWKYDALALQETRINQLNHQQVCLILTRSIRH